MGSPRYQVVGDRSLKFTSATAVGSIVPGFEYNSEQGSRAVSIKLVDSVLEPIEDSSALDIASGGNVANLYVNGGPWFRYPSVNNNSNSNIDNYPSESVLAWYLPSEKTLNKNPEPAILESRVGRGRAILSGPHFEYDPNLIASKASASSSSSRLCDHVHLLSLIPSLMQTDAHRLRLVRSVLSRFGLRLNAVEEAEKYISDSVDNSGAVPRVSPMCLATLLPSKVLQFQHLLSQLLEQQHQPNESGLSSCSSFSGQFIVQDVQHDFYLLKSADGLARSGSRSDLSHHLANNNKRLDSCISINYMENGSVLADYEGKDSFNVEKYFRYLEREYASNNYSYGSIVLYGNVVGSTQTILEK